MGWEREEAGEVVEVVRWWLSSIEAGIHFTPQLYGCIVCSSLL